MLQRYIADFVGISEHTMVDWGNFIRQSMSRYLAEHPLVLGRDHPVQIDESLFGGKCKYHRGDHATHQQSWVFGITEEKTNLCVLFTVDDRKKATLLPIIKEHVYRCAVVKSDEWSSYKSLNRAGFEHLVVNHSVMFVTEDDVHTQLIESLWSQVKSIIKVKRGTTSEMLQDYLDYFSFIRLAKHLKISATEMFFRIIKAGNFY
jgi:transposase-like protein